MAMAARRRGVPGWVQIASLSVSLLGMGIASYLTVAHYADPAALACPDTGIVNCALVTTSSWSVVTGIPVALLGLLWSVVMVGLSTPWAWRSQATWVDRLRLCLSAAGALTVLYLVYVELFKIGAICLWCTAMHVVAVSLFGLILTARALSKEVVRTASARV
jgi:uncharacterized membrane protein